MENCVFCKIVAKQIPAKVIAESDGALAFLDVNPTADGHALVIPKKHFRDLSSADEDALRAVISLTKAVAALLKDSKLDPYGINYLSNEGNLAGQEVFHFHVHVIPKYASGEGFGFKTNKVNLRPVDEVHKDLV